MIEGGVGRRTIVTSDGDPQSSGLNDLNRVIERNHVVRRTGLYMEICRDTIRLAGGHRLTFVLIGEARYFDIAELKLPNQTFETNQSFRALHSIMVKMSVSGENYIDSDVGELVQEPLWINAC